MKRLWMICLLLPLKLIAQDQFHVMIFGGLANYQGDLRYKKVSLDQSREAFGIAAKYDLSAHLAIRAGFNFAEIQADDKQNIPSLQYRNLNFQTKIEEGNLLLEYSFLDLEKTKFSPYVFAGVAIYHFNPYSFDTLGNKVYLQPLGTEGEGLPQYPDRKMYQLTQFNFPFGAGIRFKVSEGISVGYEFAFHKLFTDYLDDVSKTYVDKQVLLQARGPLAVEMAYRTGELKGGNPNYPADGTQRGNAGKYDWYYFHGITVTIAIHRGNNFTGNHESNWRKSMSCPRPREDPAFGEAKSP